MQWRLYSSVTYFLCVTLLWSWPGHTEVIQVPDLVFPTVSDTLSAREKVLRMEEASKVVLALEAAYPKSARYRCMQMEEHPEGERPGKLTDGELTIARTVDKFYYICHLRQGWNRSFSHNGTQTHLIYDHWDAVNRTNVPRGVIVENQERLGIDDLVFVLGLGNLTPFFLRNGLSKFMTHPPCLGSVGCAWEVITLDEKRLLLRLINGSGSRLVELDLLRGGNIVRDEQWWLDKEQKPKRYGYLREYELVQVDGFWLPKMYEFFSPSQEGSTTRFEYEWLELNVDSSPKNFVLQFPEGMEIKDETTVAARASRLKGEMAQKVEDWHIAFWELFE